MGNQAARGAAFAALSAKQSRYRNGILSDQISLLQLRINRQCAIQRRLRFVYLALLDQDDAFAGERRKQICAFLGGAVASADGWWNGRGLGSAKRRAAKRKHYRARENARFHVSAP